MDNKPIRVALILNRTLNGGIESLLYNYCSHISNSDVIFDFYVKNTCDIINKASVEALGGKLFMIPSVTKPNYVKTLKNLLSKGNYDIVQANINALNFLPLKAAKKAGVSVRISYSLSTSSPRERIRHIAKTMLKSFSKKYATHFFACSDNCATWLFGKRILSNANYYKVYNAVDIGMFEFDLKKRNDLQTQYNLKKRTVIGNIGRLESQKNQLFLIDVFNAFHKIEPSSFLIIIGDGCLKNKLELSIKEYGLENDVLVLGSDKTGVKAECAKYYSLFDIFVLPSIYEGLPVVGIEAQLASLPCVFSSNITKNVALSEDAIFVSLKDSIDSWTNAILKALSTKRKKVYSPNYDINIQAQRLLNIYASIVLRRDK